MAWFDLPSHIDQALIFTFLGIWHMYSTIRNYARSPSLFQTKTWFGRQELWIQLFIIVAFILKELSPTTSDLANGAIQTPHLTRFQHVSFALFFLVYTLAALVTEHTLWMPELPSEALHCAFALGFLTKLVVLHFRHESGKDSVDAFVHMLMELILGSLVGLLLLEARWPRSVLVSVARCLMLIFKGVWLGQIGLLLHFPSAVPMGCYTSKDHAFPVCPTEESLIRATSLQVLIFNSQLLCILVGTLVSYGVLMFRSRPSPTPQQSLPSPIALPIVIIPTACVVSPIRIRAEKEASVYFHVPDEPSGD